MSLTQFVLSLPVLSVSYQFFILDALNKCFFGIFLGVEISLMAFMLVCWESTMNLR